MGQRAGGEVYPCVYGEPGPISMRICRLEGLSLRVRGTQGDGFILPRRTRPHLPA